MERGLDHLVLATRDLPGLAAQIAGLGFQVGGRNRHPWGTVNHIVQFRSSFLELIGLEEGYRPVDETDAAFPFAGFLERYLDRNESGLAMAVLNSVDARADAALFARTGLGEGRLLPFSRSARAPDGSDRTVAFTIAFASSAAAPEIGFFTCEQHRPENFWNPAFQDHANGAIDLTGFTILAERPNEHASFLAGLSGRTAEARDDGAITVALEGGEVVVESRDRSTREVSASIPPTAAAQILAAHVRFGGATPAEARLECRDGDWTLRTRA